MYYILENNQQTLFGWNNYFCHKNNDFVPIKTKKKIIFENFYKQNDY